MFPRHCLIFLAIAAGINSVHNKSIQKSGLTVCFKQECPLETVACEKFSKMSKDKKYLECTVNCLNREGDKIKTVSLSEPNPFSPATLYQGYSYSSVFEIRHNNNNDDRITYTSSTTEKYEDSDKNKEIEDFSR